jgi:uncharacterized cupredoxin-like copper-binding protein
MRHDLWIPGPVVARGALFVAAALMVAACSGSGASSSPAGAPSAAASGSGGASVAAKLSEFKIELAATTAPAGSVTFALTNGGTTVHEFVVFKTDLAADKLPLAADGTEVDEAGAGLTAVDEVEDIAVGATASLPVDLVAGHYVLICNIPAHYTSGMRAAFTTN